MKKYIESISKLNGIALTTSNDEIDRYSESDIFWASHKDGSGKKHQIRKGEIYQFEFGKNYVPEMSYEHRGLVIGISQKLLYVLPIYSYKPASHRALPLHITDNPTGKSDFYLLKQSEYSFLKRDSIVKLNDIRTVSDARIKYAHGASIPSDSDTYKFIEQRVFRRYFPSISFEYDRTAERAEELQNRVDELERTLAELSCPSAEKR